jgi:hypothetical protein
VQTNQLAKKNCALHFDFLSVRLTAMTIAQTHGFSSSTPSLVKAKFCRY